MINFCACQKHLTLNLFSSSLKGFYCFFTHFSKTNKGKYIMTLLQYPIWVNTKIGHLKAFYITLIITFSIVSQLRNKCCELSKVKSKQQWEREWEWQWQRQRQGYQHQQLQLLCLNMKLFFFESFVNKHLKYQ